MKYVVTVILLLFVTLALADTPAYKICPKCGKVFQLEYKYCPFDGTLLVQIGGYEAEGEKEKATATPSVTKTPMRNKSRATPEGVSPPGVTTPKPHPTATPVIIKMESGEERVLHPSDFSGTPKGCPDDMVYIPAGSFNMGTKTFPFSKDAKMVHSVYLDGYCIDKYEYPNKLFKMPIAKVNYYEAAEKCAVEGKRLCTEAEWEKACKGPDFFEYPYGNKYDISACWIEKGRMDGPKISGEMARCVSPYGVFDMSGNVAEWVYDYYDENYYYTSPKSNPKGPDSGVTRVIRGGSFLDFGMRTRCAYRFNKSPDYSNRRVGFRCCMTP